MDEESPLASCRDCGHDVSHDAFACPNCGAPKPSSQNWDGVGFEWKSPLTLFGLPFVHISFKYRNRRPVVAKGIFAIGQFGVGVFTIAQFGVGFVSISQFALGAIIIAQIAAGWTGIAQIGFLPGGGFGQMIVP